jgi:hypothetical protein
VEQQPGSSHNAFTGAITKIVVTLTADEGHHTKAQRQPFRN